MRHGAAVEEPEKLRSNYRFIVFDYHYCQCFNAIQKNTAVYESYSRIAHDPQRQMPRQVPDGGWGAMGGGWKRDKSGLYHPRDCGQDWFFAPNNHAAVGARAGSSGRESCGDAGQAPLRQRSKQFVTLDPETESHLKELGMSPRFRISGRMKRGVNR